MLIPLRGGWAHIRLVAAITDTLRPRWITTSRFRRGGKADSAAPFFLLDPIAPRPAGSRWAAVTALGQRGGAVAQVLGAGFGLCAHWFFLRPRKGVGKALMDGSPKVAVYKARPSTGGKLNSKGYILPGLGEDGRDRLFGTRGGYKPLPTLTLLPSPVCSIR